VLCKRNWNGNCFLITTQQQILTMSDFTKQKKSLLLSGFGKSKKIKNNKAPSVSEEHNGDRNMPENVAASLSEHEILMLLEKFMDDMNLAEEKKEPIRSKDLALKRAMVVQWLNKTTIKKGEQAKTPQQFYLDLQNLLRKDDLSRGEDKSKEMLNVLSSLKVSLTSNPLSWVQNFGREGLDILLRILNDCYDHERNGEVENRMKHEIIRCLKAFMNNRYGIRDMFDREYGIVTLCRAVDPKNKPMMTDTVKLVAAVCLISDGHERVLEALTVCHENKMLNSLPLTKEQKKNAILPVGPSRFDPIIEGLRGHEKYPQLRVACLQLVNVLVCTPEELDFRMHLRGEFMRAGLQDCYEELKSSQNEELQIQFGVFEEHRDGDFEELVGRYCDVKIIYEYPFYFH